MKIQSSAFTESERALYRALLDALLGEYGYASVLAASAKTGSYRVSRRGSAVSCDHSERGFVIRIHDGRGFAEYSGNTLTREGIPALLDRIRAELIPLGTGFDMRELPLPEDAELALASASEAKVHPETLGDEAILARISALREAALAEEPRLLDAGVFVSYREYHNLFLSKNRELTDDRLWCTGGISLSAKREGVVKSYYRGYSGLAGMEVLDGMEQDIPELARVTVELLSAEPMIPGEYDCICAPDVTGMIVHEAFGHGVEMDMFVKDRALAASYIGKAVASPLVTMHDGAAAAEQTASFAFDDEGTEAHDTVVIDRGILVSGISDSISAATLGTAPTGNGRRESFRRKAYTRMTNTFFEAGEDTLEDMIASIEYGFLLENASSGMEDPKNWGIQCMVNIAREIKDGCLTGRIFSPIVLSGYVPDLLKSISMMSETKVLSGTGFCGKGYKEWVKVSDGGPYIKAKIRLG